MGLQFKVVPKTKAALLAQSNPQSASQPEVFPWVLFDTVSYVSGTTVTLSFFQTVQTDKSLGNMEGGGQLPDPQFFEIYKVGLDVLLRPAAQAGHAATGPVDDIAKLTLSGRGNFIFSISNKNYGPFPLSFLHASGGPTGFGWATMTAEAQVSYANNGIFDGGYPINGSLVIPPKVGFSIVLNWPAALTLAAGNTNLRVWMYGALYRRVL
jgi:hypothetical protein